MFYRVSQPAHYGVDDILDMVRYARAKLLKVESYEKGRGKQYIFSYQLGVGGRKHWNTYVKRRWESFGCTIEVLDATDELKKLDADFDFTYGQWYEYDAEEFKKIWTQALLDYAGIIPVPKPKIHGGLIDAHSPEIQQILAKPDSKPEDSK